MVQQTRQRRTAIWSVLEPLINEDRLASWRRILDTQTKYAATHGKSTNGKPRPMAPSSHASLLGRTIGTVRKYRPDLFPVPPFVKDAIKQQEALGRKRGVQRAIPIDKKTIYEIIEQLRSRNQRRAALFMELLWLCAARGTSILSLQQPNVHMNHHTFDTHQTVSLLFTEGKTVKSTGAYTLHIAISALTAAALLKYLAKPAKKTQRIFSRSDMKQVSASLKEAGLEMRSVRRGALQTMARAGASPATLLLFSRHTETKGLYAYLGDGLECRWEASQTFPWSLQLQ